MVILALLLRFSASLRSLGICAEQSVRVVRFGSCVIQIALFANLLSLRHSGSCPVFRRDEGQYRSTTHFSQSGLRALQTRLP